MRKIFDSPNLKALFLSRGRGYLTHLKILALDVFIGKEEIFYQEHLIKIMLTITKIGRNFVPKL